MKRVARWVLVIPALIVGAAVVGALFQTMWDWVGNSLEWLPVIGGLIAAIDHGIGRILNNVLSGACGVYFPLKVAPSRRRLVGLASAFILCTVSTALLINALLLSNYYEDVPALTVLWEVIQYLIFVGAAAVAGFFAWYTEDDPEENLGAHGKT